MEPIPVFYENVRRSALVIRPKSPFSDWLKSIDPKDEADYSLEEGDVYLLPDFEEVKQMDNWLKKHFDEIFTDQLNNWFVDEQLWPQNRTYKMFKEWFNFSMHTMIWDTLESSIHKD